MTAVTRLGSLFTCIAALIAVRPQPKCMHANGTGVALRGKLTWKTFFGPPNYGEEPLTDSRIRLVLLKLDAPISICTDTVLGVRYGRVKKMSVVQLVSLEGKLHGESEGLEVDVEGDLERAQSGHHVTPVILAVDTIRPIKPPTIGVRNDANLRAREYAGFIQIDRKGILTAHVEEDLLPVLKGGNLELTRFSGRFAVWDSSRGLT